MKEIVVISGKGGTGKTSITAGLSHIAGDDAVVADCDVDAANMHILLSPEIRNTENFYSGYRAEIVSESCINCDICRQICRFDAIIQEDDTYKVLEDECEGCGYCEKVCPVSAIEMKPMYNGDFYSSVSKFNQRFYFANLAMSRENSGRLVTKLKEESAQYAEHNNNSYLLVDGPPGMGCPVVASITGADYVVFVTEPTMSGLHDLKRVHSIITRFDIPSACIINKADINTDINQEIEEFCRNNAIYVLSEIYYNYIFSESLMHKQTVTEYSGENKLYATIADIWQKLLAQV